MEIISKLERRKSLGGLLPLRQPYSGQFFLDSSDTFGD